MGGGTHPCWRIRRPPEECGRLEGHEDRDSSKLFFYEFPYLRIQAMIHRCLVPLLICLISLMLLVCYFASVGQHSLPARVACSFQLDKNPLVLQPLILESFLQFLKELPLTTYHLSTYSFAPVSYLQTSGGGSGALQGSQLHKSGFWEQIIVFASVAL